VIEGVSEIVGYEMEWNEVGRDVREEEMIFGRDRD